MQCLSYVPKIEKNDSQFKTIITLLYFTSYILKMWKNIIDLSHKSSIF